ncbi:hypothetical protein ACEPAG_8226 [Sanghuangporus baumii]
MGGRQAYHWAVVYPDFVERIIVICASTCTSNHNICFLEGPKAALTAAKDFGNGRYKTLVEQGIRAFARVYSAWSTVQRLYQQLLRDSIFTAHGLFDYIPGKFDFYFPVEDSEYEVSHFVDARLAGFPPIWGHAAGVGESPADVSFITERIKDFFETRWPSRSIYQ